MSEQTINLTKTPSNNLALKRKLAIAQLKSESFDLIVIGGGITGAGIALDATTRGLKTALVEKNDFAFGSSSRSTKLIHGGLRYLKQLEFGLVKEVGSERAIVHSLSPHLVVPEKMLLPLYEKRGLGRILTSIGLKLYDWLAGVKTEDRRKMLTRKQTLAQEPLLIANDIKGGAIYAEYRTDDARLTIEIIKTASRYGAVVCNYCVVENLLYNNIQVSGISVNDIVSDERFTIMSQAVINATGPWVDSLRRKDNSLNNKVIFLSKGVHIVVANERLPVSQSSYFNVGDGRMIFAIPRGRTTYIGTTDTPFSGNIDDLRTEVAEVEYLLKSVNETFTDVNLKLSDVESSWVGLRPLIFEDGKSANELSRKDEIFVSGSGLISIAGGKLTGYRKMAERTVDLVIKRIFKNQRLKPCSTSSISLTKSNFKNYSSVLSYQQSISQRLIPLGLSNHVARLVNSYGQECDEILNSIHQFDTYPSGTKLALAELKYCLENEMVISASDFFVRRTGMLYFDLPRLRAVLIPCLEAMAKFHGWDEQKSDFELKNLNKLIEMASNWK